MEEEKIVCLDASAPASAALFRKRSKTFRLWRRDREHFEPFAFEPRTHFIDGRGLNRARDNLACRRSQTTNRLSHTSNRSISRDDLSTGLVRTPQSTRGG